MSENNLRLISVMMLLLMMLLISGCTREVIRYVQAPATKVPADLLQYHINPEAPRTYGECLEAYTDAIGEIEQCNIDKRQIREMQK